jgi:cell cycle checkpoint protein
MPSKEVLDIVVQSSNGDIRSAVMALQFACTADAISAKAKPGKRKSPDDETATKESTRAFLECITRREHSLALFHLLGKVFYNKRTSPQVVPLLLTLIG